jgi:tetratricopeptide (TPR) repeat protein
VAEHDGLAKSWHRAARACEGVGDAEGAIDAWRTASEIDPTVAEPHERLAELLTDKRPIDSIPHLRWLAQADGAKVKVWQRLARALEQAGDLAGSVDAWKEVAAQAPTDAEASLKLSRGLPKLGRWLEAIPYAEAVARKTGDDVKVWINLARLLKRAGASEEELRAWRQVLFLDPRSVEAHSRLAHLLWTSDRKSEAAEHMKALAGLAPGEIGRWKQLAAALEDIGDQTGAIGALRKALAIRPEDVSSHERMGELLLALGRKPEAVQHMRRYAELSGERTKPWRNLARLLEELGRERDAARAWRRVLKVSESDSEAHERLASLSGREGDKAGAIRHIEALARIAPKDAAGWDRLARARADVGDLAGAVEAWRLALAASEEPEFHTQIGIALLPLDRKPAALEHFQRAAALTPMEERRWRHLARCAQDVGEAAVAADAWRQVLALTGTDEEAREGLLALGGSREEELSVQSDAGYAAALLRFWGEISAREEPHRESVRHIASELAKVIGGLTGFARITHPESIGRRLEALDRIFRDPRFASLAAARPDDIQEVLSGLEGDGAALAQQALMAAGPDLARALIAAPAGSAARFAVDETQARALRLGPDPAFQRPVLICGFHHSGTRVLAQALQGAGVFQKMNTPSLEWTYVQWLNTIMLPGWTDVEAIRAFDPQAAAAFISQDELAFRLAAAGYGGQGPWAHKDPRNSVTAGAWLKAFPGLRIVHITRQPDDVLGTLPGRYARYSPGGKSPQETLDFWSALWTSYLDATRAAMAGAAHSIEVTFEDLCREPRAVMGRIAKALDLDVRLSATDIAGLGLNPEKIGEHRLWLDRGQLDGDDLARLQALGAASLPGSGRS